MRSKILVIFFITLVSLSGSPKTLCAKANKSIIKERVIELATSIEECIEKKDTSHPVFHGCIDWHSAVHAHWALIRAYRFTKNEHFLEKTISTLNSGKMNDEFNYIKNNSHFEMPYGRAWFLKLIIEYEKATGSKRFRHFSNYIAGTLYEYISLQTFNPNKREYKNICWVVSNLYQYYRHKNDYEKIKILREYIKNYDNYNLDLKFDKSNSDFFSLWGNFSYMLSFILDDSEYNKWLKKQIYTPELIKPVEHINSNHHLGVNYSRAWGFWKAFEKSNNDKFLYAYDNAINMGFSFHKKYKGNYSAYGHWVPQFGILALTMPYYDEL